MFIVFAGQSFYPRGGAEDLIFMTTKRDQALMSLAQAASSNEWGHVFDASLGRIIESFELVGTTVQFTTHN